MYSWFVVVHCLPLEGAGSWRGLDPGSGCYNQNPCKLQPLRPPHMHSRPWPPPPRPLSLQVAVNVEFRNPLQIKLRVSGVHLLCEFTPSDSAAKPAQMQRSDSVAAGGSSAADAADPLHPLSDNHIRTHDLVGDNRLASSYPA